MSGFASLVDLAIKMEGGKVDIQKLQLPREYSEAETALRKYSALGQVMRVRSSRQRPQMSEVYVKHVVHD